MIEGISNGLDESQYLIGAELGSGSYGTVVQAFDRDSNQSVAIKHIPCIYDVTDAILIAREIRFLHALRCDNIVSLIDLAIDNDGIYIITQLCKTDLCKLIQSNKDSPVKWKPFEYLHIMYQVLNALSFMHSVDVIHRDIKPANILVDNNLTIKICDFGLARVLETGANEAVIEADTPNLTEYVVSRWYRAPEIVLVPGRYGKAQDVWATACTFAEMIRKEPLFPGTTLVDQLQVIVDVLGKPTVEDLDFEMAGSLRSYITAMSSRNFGLYHAIQDIHHIHPELFLLMQKMLKFNPHERFTSMKAFESPVFSCLRLCALSTSNNNNNNNRSSNISTLHNDIQRVNRSIIRKPSAMISILREEVTLIKNDLETFKQEQYLTSSIAMSPQFPFSESSTSTSILSYGFYNNMSSKKYSELSSNKSNPSISYTNTNSKLSNNNNNNDNNNSNNNNNNNVSNNTNNTTKNKNNNKLIIFDDDKNNNSNSNNDYNNDNTSNNTTKSEGLISDDENMSFQRKGFNIRRAITFDSSNNNANRNGNNNNDNDSSNNKSNNNINDNESNQLLLLPLQQLPIRRYSLSVMFDHHKRAMTECVSGPSRLYTTTTNSFNNTTTVTATNTILHVRMKPTSTTTTTSSLHTKSSVFPFLNTWYLPIPISLSNMRKTMSSISLVGIGSGSISRSRSRSNYKKRRSVIIDVHRQNENNNEEVELFVIDSRKVPSEVARGTGVGGTRIGGCCQSDGIDRWSTRPVHTDTGIGIGTCCFNNNTHNVNNDNNYNESNDNDNKLEHQLELNHNDGEQYDDTVANIDKDSYHHHHYYHSMDNNDEYYAGDGGRDGLNRSMNMPLPNRILEHPSTTRSLLSFSSKNNNTHNIHNIQTSASSKLVVVGSSTSISTSTSGVRQWMGQVLRRIRRVSGSGSGIRRSWPSVNVLNDNDDDVNHTITNTAQQYPLYESSTTTSTSTSIPSHNIRTVIESVHSRLYLNHNNPYRRRQRRRESV